MKKIIILIVSLFLLVGCKKQEELTLSGKKVHFFECPILETPYAMALPANFLSLNEELLEIRFEGEEHPEQMLVSPNNDAWVRMDSVEDSFSEDQLSIYLDFMEKTLKESNTSFHFLSKRVLKQEEKSIGILEFTYDYQETNYYEFLLYFVEDGSLKEIHFSAHGNEVDTWKKLGEKMTHSIHKREEIEDED